MNPKMGLRLPSGPFPMDSEHPPLGEYASAILKPFPPATYAIISKECKKKFFLCFENVGMNAV